MDLNIIYIGTTLAALLLPSFVVSFFKLAKKKKTTNKQVNTTAALITVGLLFGIPALWLASCITVAGFSYISPLGHLYIWGSIIVLAVLIGVFAIIRRVVIATEGK